MATLKEAADAQIAVLNEISSCGADDPNLVAVLEQQTTGLRTLFENLRAANNLPAAGAGQPTPQPDESAPEQPTPEQPEDPQQPAPQPEDDLQLPEVTEGALVAAARDFRASWTSEEYARVSSDVGSEVASAFDNAAQLTTDEDVKAALAIIGGKPDLADRMQKVLGAKMEPAATLFAAVAA